LNLSAASGLNPQMPRVFLGQDVWLKRHGRAERFKGVLSGWNIDTKPTALVGNCFEDACWATRQEVNVWERIG